MTPAKIVRAFGSAMGSRVATAALNYGLFWSLSRMLSTEMVGGFSLLMTIFLMVQQLPLLGLGVPLMRRAATAPRDLSSEMSNAFAFAAPVSVVLALAVGIWGHLAYGEELTLAFWLVAISLIPTAWTIVAEAALLGGERVGDVARINFIEALLRTALAIACVWLGYGLVGVFVVFAVLRLVAALLYALHPALALPSPALWEWRLQRRNWREMPVFFGIALVAALVSRLDVITLSHLRGLHDVATYAAASRLYDAAQMIPTMTALVVLPTLARQFVSSRAQFRDTLALSVRISLTIGLGLALVASSLAQPVIDLLYRPELAEAAPVLRFLIFAAVIMMVDVILSSTMLAASAQKHDLRSLALGLVALGISLAVLVPRFGPVGAAGAVTVGLVARVAARLHWAVRELGLPSPWLHLIRLVVACGLGVAALLFALPYGAIAAGAAGLGAYALSVVLVGALGRHPMRELRSDIALITQRGPAG